jgi:hypothetical protein
MTGREKEVRDFAAHCRNRAAAPFEPSRAAWQGFAEWADGMADDLRAVREALEHARSVMVRAQHRNDAAMMDALRQVEAALAS